MQELADPQSVEDHKELFAIGAAIELVLEECSSTIASLAETLPRNKIRWETLWMILPPNVHVYTKDAFGQDRVYLVRRHHQIRKQDGSVLLQMETEHVDSDGSKLGIVQDVIELPQFGGVSAINDLPIYPLEYHPRVIELRLELLERGKKQLVYHGPGPKGPHHITEHKGFGLKPGSRRLEKFNVSCITFFHCSLILLCLLDPRSTCHRCSGYQRDISRDGPCARIGRFPHPPWTSDDERPIRHRQ
jgi:hypothetical protein